MGVQSYIINFYQRLGINCLTFEEMCDSFFYSEEQHSIKFDWELWY